VALRQDQGRIALVSDGAHGIGAATVRKLAADGWDVSFCYREDALAASRVEKAASELGARVTAIQADICDPAAVSSWFERTLDELGPVTAMVSCAGITRDQPLTRLTDQDWRAVTDAGLDGTFQLCRAATSAMLKRRTGRIVAVSSVCGAYDHCAQGHDISSRPGLAAFIRALADHTRRYGITVNAVIPSSATHDLTAIVPGPSRADVTETVAVCRFRDAADVADLVTFLLSGAAAAITGSVLEARGAIALLVRSGRTARRSGTSPSFPPGTPTARGPAGTAPTRPAAA
jgi:3-oxoacyl-[acyl-carrier protein] reductase